MQTHTPLSTNVFPPVEQAIKRQTGTKPTTQAKFRRALGQIAAPVMGTCAINTVTATDTPKLGQDLGVTTSNVIVFDRAFSNGGECFVEIGLALSEVDAVAIRGRQDLPDDTRGIEEHAEKVVRDEVEEAECAVRHGHGFDQGDRARISLEDATSSAICILIGTEELLGLQEEHCCEIVELGDTCRTRIGFRKTQRQ